MNEIFKFKYDLNDEQWAYLKEATEIEKVIVNKPLMEAILHFAQQCITQNPYYKFFEVLSWVRDADHVHFNDLVTLDRYYPNMHAIDFLLTPTGKYFTGANAQSKEQLEKLIDAANTRFTYDYLCQLIISLHISEYSRDICRE